MEHAGHMGEMKIHTEFWLESLKGKDHLKDLGIDGRIIFKWILGKWGMEAVESIDI
jgi:hypothetical protein